MSSGGEKAAPRAHLGNCDHGGFMTQKLTNGGRQGQTSHTHITHTHTRANKQTNKQNNQQTQQPNNQAAKQPSNQAAKKPTNNQTNKQANKPKIATNQQTTRQQTTIHPHKQQNQQPTTDTSLPQLHRCQADPVLSRQATSQDNPRREGGRKLV